MLAWLTQLLFAAVVAGGALATATVIPGGADLLEESEDGESVEESAVHGRETREASSGAPPSTELDRLEVPASLGPKILAGPRPRTWLGPRRVPPDDDDANA